MLCNVTRVQTEARHNAFVPSGQFQHLGPILLGGTINDHPDDSNSLRVSHDVGWMADEILCMKVIMRVEESERMVR